MAATATAGPLLSRKDLHQALISGTPAEIWAGPADTTTANRGRGPPGLKSLSPTHGGRNAGDGPALPALDALRTQAREQRAGRAAGTSASTSPPRHRASNGGANIHRSSSGDKHPRAEGARLSADTTDSPNSGIAAAAAVAAAIANAALSAPGPIPKLPPSPKKISGLEAGQSARMNRMSVMEDVREARQYSMRLGPGESLFSVTEGSPTHVRTELARLEEVEATTTQLLKRIPMAPAAAKPDLGEIGRDTEKWLERHKQLRDDHFTQAQKHELKQWFDALDSDGSGEISINELAAPLLSTGLADSLEGVKKHIRAVARDNRGQIDFEEFVKIFRPRHGNKQGGINPSQLIERLTTGAGVQGTPGGDLNATVDMHRRKLLMDAVVYQTEASAKEWDEIDAQMRSSTHDKGQTKELQAKLVNMDRKRRQTNMLLDSLNKVMFKPDPRDGRQSKVNKAQMPKGRASPPGGRLNALADDGALDAPAAAAAVW